MKNILSLLLLSPGILIAQTPVQTRTYIDDPGLVPREKLVDMTHMKLNVGFEPEKGLVNGTVTHYFTPLRKKVDTLFLDGPGIQVKSATLNGKTVRFNSDSRGITFYPSESLMWGESDSLKIEYEATPRKGIYFIGWNDPNNLSRKQIWTQGQATDNRYWFPSFDSQNDKLTTEVITTFNSRYKVLSNGILVDKKTVGDNTIWHYRMNKPHTTYLVMLGIGEYDIKNSTSESGVPIASWYYPGYEDRVELTYRFSEKMMDFFEEELGVPYPWETYAQIPVQDFMYGAMENTTATLFGDFYLVDERSFIDRSYVATNAHELAHQWFGDYVTARSGTHHWLQESFATYYSLLFDLEVYGQDYFDWQRREDQLISLNAGKQNALPIAHSQAGSARWYPKGAMVLHMLRYVLGEDQYRKGITHYLKQYPYQNVDSEDLLVAFHDALGVSLDWFWEQWVYRGGEPYYQVDFNQITNNASVKENVFTVKQEQNTGDVLPLFNMPFWFYVEYEDGSADSLYTVISEKDQVVRIPNSKGKKVKYALFDPGQQVLKAVTFIKPESQLRAQALEARYVLDRFEAVKGLEKYGLPANKGLFEKIMRSDEFYGVKGEIIRQASLSGKEGYDLVRMGLRDKNPQVNKIAVNSLETVPEELKKDVSVLIEKGSYETAATALDKLATYYPEEIPKFIERVGDASGTRGNNLLVKSLEVQASSDTAAMNRLVDLTSNSYEFITRTNAMAALQRLNHLDTEMLENLLNAAFSPNSRLAGPARQTLKSLANQNQYRSLIYNYVRSIRYADWQKEVIEDILD